MPSLLYVDDEPAMRQLVQFALGSRGIKVHGAEGVADAQRCCGQQEFDGVVVDIWLQDGSGFEFFAWLQEHCPALARNTVFVTGDVSVDTDVRRRLQALDRPVLAKPFDLRELEQEVRQWSSRRSTPSAKTIDATFTPGRTRDLAH
jgi:DNA-binding NtrC family response regulator